MSHEDAAEIEEQAGLLNITVNEGIDFPLQLTWKDAAGVIIDLTDYTAKMQIREQAHSCSALILELSTDPNAGIILGGILGTVDIRIDANINVFGTNKYFYDLELTNVSGEAFKLVRGEFNSISEITT